MTDAKLDAARTDFERLDAEMREAVVEGRKWRRWPELRAARRKLEALRHARKFPRWEQVEVIKAEALN